MLKGPKGAVTQLAGGDDFVFPKGNYGAVLEEVRTRGIPVDESGEPFSGWTTDDGTVLGLQFGQFDPLDVEVDAGERKFFVDITLRDGELTLEDVDISERGAAAWQLQRSARILLNLFLATGHAEETEDGEIVVPDAAIAELEAGELNGVAVGISIANRKESPVKYKKRLQDDPQAVRRVYDSVKTFFAV